MAVPLGFFVKGEPYELMGVIPMETRFFGVDMEEWNERYPDPASAPETTPTFYFMGAAVTAATSLAVLFTVRVSLSVGLVVSPSPLFLV